ncbi:MAG: PstS family phosphate ABC transporter substrate-binding protein [Pirellulales bacterium]
MQLRTNRRVGPWLAGLMIGSLTLAGSFGCGKKQASNSEVVAFKPDLGTIKPAEIPDGSVVEVDGSSTVYPVSEAVAEEFQIAVDGRAKVTVGIKGTGGGFQRFCRGELDISDASRPITAAEMKLAKENGIEYIELPICFDALTVVVHKDNDWADSITVAELKKLWEPAAEEKITNWNQVRAEWPDKELVLFGPGTDSGTFDYFTEAVVGKAKSSRGDFTSSEDDNVLVQGIEGNPNALGYFGYAYYEPNKEKMKALAIQDGDKPPVKPSMSTVLDGTYTPLSRPLFIYVNKKSAEKPEVKAFVEFYLNNVKALSAEVSYVPLPDKAYEMAKERFEKRTVGTGYGGEPGVGMRIEDILKREPKF